MPVNKGPIPSSYGLHWQDWQQLNQKAAKSLTDAASACLDMRSPAEFAQDHVPDARNCPVLSNAERHQVGLLYQQDRFQAKRLGAALMMRNLAQYLMQQWQHHDASWQPLVYCWRGGKRSQASVHVLREIGWSAHYLIGGYQQYRRHVVQQLQLLPAQLRFVVLCGATGSGKTTLLHALSQRGAQILDLEKLARHKGSVLGATPFESQPSQKMFDSFLVAALERFTPERVVFVEAESARIGSIHVPQTLIAQMHEGQCILLQTPKRQRALTLATLYAPQLNSPLWLHDQINRLRPFQSKERIEGWHQLIELKDWEALANSLLEHHYDRLYHHSQNQHFKQLPNAEILPLPSLQEQELQAAATHLCQRYG